MVISQEKGLGIDRFNVIFGTHSPKLISPPLVVSAPLARKKGHSLVTEQGFTERNLTDKYSFMFGMMVGFFQVRGGTSVCPKIGPAIRYSVHVTYVVSSCQTKLKAYRAISPSSILTRES